MRKLAIAVTGLLVAGGVLGWILLPDGMGILDNLTSGATIVWYAPDFPPDESLDYKQTPTRALQVHVFRRDADTKPGATVVLFHGGGFHSGWPDELFPLASQLAAAGHTVFVPEYRLQRKDGVAYSDELEDSRDAVAWVQAAATSFGGDPAKLVIGGSSAGAHLAAAVVTLPRDDGTPHPAAIGLLLSAPYLDSADASERFEARARERGMIEVLLLGEAHDVFEGRGAELSPRAHLHAGMPPTAVMAGAHDRLLAPGREFCEAMNALGVDCHAKAYPGAGHAFALFGYDNYEMYVRDVLAALERWLRAHASDPRDAGWSPVSRRVRARLRTFPDSGSRASGSRRAAG